MTWVEKAAEGAPVPVHGLALLVSQNRSCGQKRSGATRQLANITACSARTATRSGAGTHHPILVPSSLHWCPTVMLGGSPPETGGEPFSHTNQHLCTSDHGGMSALPWKPHARRPCHILPQVHDASPPQMPLQRENPTEVKPTAEKWGCTQQERHRASADTAPS